MQKVFNALYGGKQLIKRDKKNVALMDERFYSALITPESMDRLRQILPSVGGTCVVDICCIDRRGGKKVDF